MNNSFIDFVKKSEKKVAFRLALVVLGIALFVVLCFFVNMALLVMITLCIFVVIFAISANKNKEKMRKYGVQENRNLYVNLINNKDFLIGLANVLNSDINITDFNGSLVEYVQKLIDEKEIIFSEYNFNLETFVNRINELLKHKNINLSINCNDIINNDTDEIKKIRKDGINNDFNDLAVIRHTLQVNGYEMILFWASNDGFSKLARIDCFLISIIPISKISDIRKLYIDENNFTN